MEFWHSRIRVCSKRHTFLKDFCRCKSTRLVVTRATKAPTSVTCEKPNRCCLMPPLVLRVKYFVFPLTSRKPLNEFLPHRVSDLLYCDCRYTLGDTGVNSPWKRKPSKTAFQGVDVLIQSVWSSKQRLIGWQEIWSETFPAGYITHSQDSTLWSLIYSPNLQFCPETSQIKTAEKLWFIRVWGRWFVYRKF